MKISKNIIVKSAIKILILCIGFMMMSTIKSYGAVSITKGTSVFTERSISDFYDMSKEMKDAGQGLEGTSVDVHMATNKEWATVSYFSNSNYGTATQGKNTGLDVTVDGVTYKSTNGNATGVMDWGKMCTFTSGILDNYADIADTSDQYTNGKSIIENATNSKYVDLLNSVKFSSMAITYWYSTFSQLSNSLEYPYSLRIGLFGFQAGYYGSSDATSGVPRNNVTFRPVILN